MCWCGIMKLYHLIVVMSVIISASREQLIPSGAVLVCPDSVVEFKCNVTNGTALQWTLITPNAGIKSYGFVAESFNQSVLGVPLGRTPPGITVTPLVVSSTIISSTSVDVAQFNLTLRAFEVMCESGGSTYTASIRLFDPPTVELHYESTGCNSPQVTLSWSLLSGNVASVDHYTISLTPSPPDPSFTQPFPTSNTSVTLTLHDTVTYSVTVTTNSCVGSTHNMTSVTVCADSTSDSGTPRCSNGGTRQGNCSIMTTNGNDQMAPSFGLVPILVIAVVATAFVLGAIFAAICIIVAVSKRKSATALKANCEESSQEGTGYTHFGFNATAGNTAAEEYSTLNHPKPKVDSEEIEEYATVRGELSFQGTRKKPPKPSSLNYADIDTSKSKRDGVGIEMSINLTGVQYSAVKVKTEPEDKLLNLDTLVMQLRPVESKWEEIGDALSISQDKLKTIKNSTTGKDLDCLVEMCDAWIKKVFDRECQPTWRAVGRALVRADCQELAKDIKGIYDTGVLPRREADATVNNAESNYDDVVTSTSTQVETLQYDDVTGIRAPPPIPPYVPVDDSVPDGVTNSRAPPPLPPHVHGSQAENSRVPPPVPSHVHGSQAENSRVPPPVPSHVQLNAESPRYVDTDLMVNAPPSIPPRMK